MMETMESAILRPGAERSEASVDDMARLGDGAPMSASIVFKNCCSHQRLQILRNQDVK